MQHQQTMAQLHQKVNPQEKVVGWFSTGSEVSGSDALIHAFYAQECANPVRSARHAALSMFGKGFGFPFKMYKLAAPRGAFALRRKGRVLGFGSGGKREGRWPLLQQLARHFLVRLLPSRQQVGRPVHCCGAICEGPPCAELQYL